MKKLSVGTIITNGRVILCGHVTGKKYFDLPKGGQEEGEGFLATAKRELHEEFGIFYPTTKFEELGQFAYNKDKDLYLYMIYDSSLAKLNLSLLKCTSTLEQNGSNIPEMDAYELIPLSQIDSYLYPNMCKLLHTLGL